MTIAYHRLVANLKRNANTLPSFWLPILSRYAFALRRGFEALGAQIYDPLIFAEFKSTFRAGIISLRKSTKAFNWLLATLYAALGLFLTAIKVTQSIFVLMAAVFILYPQYKMTTSEHKKVVSELQYQLKVQETETLNMMDRLKRQQAAREKADAAHQRVLKFYKSLATEHCRSAKEAKAERDVLRQQLRLGFSTTATSNDATELQETGQAAVEEDEELKKAFVEPADETGQDAQVAQDTQDGGEEGDEAHGSEKALVHLPMESLQVTEKEEEGVDQALVLSPGEEVEEGVDQALVLSPEQVHQDADQGGMDTTEASVAIPEAAPQSSENGAEDLSQALFHITEGFPQDAAAGDEHVNEQPVQTPEATQPDPQKLELDLQKASNQVSVLPLTPAKPDTAASPLEDQKPKLSAAASSFVPSRPDFPGFQPPPGIMSSIHFFQGFHDSTPPVSPQAYPLGRTSHFGHSSERPFSPQFHTQPPLPPPFHTNGFRPGAPIFVAPPRQPNVAGQMFVPRPDRRSNRQRSQRQRSQQQQNPQGYGAWQGQRWVPNTPGTSSPLSGYVVNQAPEGL